MYFAPDGSSWNLTKAIFAFSDSLTIGSNLNKLVLEGANALSVQSDGNITIQHSFNGSALPTTPHVPGGTLTDGYDAYYADTQTSGYRIGQGNLGGYGGGRGPGKGISAGITYAGGLSGGGGSFGGEGGPGASGAGGMSYGSAGLDEMIGGSGGGLGNLGDAGAGGGALELNATGKVLIGEAVNISLRGGTVFVHPQFGANYSGGAGSGGSIKLIGSSIENLGSLDVRGGDAAGADSREPGVRYLRNAGGAGGGGRVAMLSDGQILPGNILLDGGKGIAGAEPGLPGSLYIGQFTSSTPNELILNSGTLVFDTAGSWSHSSGINGKGDITSTYLNVDGFPYGFGVCEFVFSSLHLGPEVSVVFQGGNSIRLRIDGNATIGTDLILDGKSGKSGIYSGLAGPGGWNSGRSLSNGEFPNSANSVLSGMGPGGGLGSAIFLPVVRVEVTEAMGQLVITMAPLDKFMEMIISPTSSVDLVEQDLADERQMVVVVVVLFRLLLEGHFFWKKMPQSLQMVEQGYPVDRVVVQQEAVVRSESKRQISIILDAWKP